MDAENPEKERKVETRRMEKKRGDGERPAMAGARNPRDRPGRRARSGRPLAPATHGVAGQAPAPPQRRALNPRPAHRVVKTRQNLQGPGPGPGRLAAPTCRPGAPRPMSLISANLAVVREKACVGKGGCERVEYGGQRSLKKKK